MVKGTIRRIAHLIGLGCHHKMVSAWSHHKSFWARHDRIIIETYVLSYETQNIDLMVYVMQRFTIWVWELVTHDEVQTSSRRPKSVPY